MYVIYALIDPRDNKVRYVGMTDSVYVRFAQHLRCDGSNPIKDAWIQELKQENMMVVMTSLQFTESLDQAKRREAYWLRHYYDLGMVLTNQSLPVYHENVVVVRTETTSKLRIGMTPDEQREYIIGLLNSGMPAKKIETKVQGFIHPKTVRGIVREVMTPPKPLAPAFIAPQPSSVEEVIDEVARLQFDGYTQDEIIEKIWKIKKGGSPRYQASRDIYRACNQAIKQRQQEQFEGSTI